MHLHISIRSVAGAVTVVISIIPPMPTQCCLEYKCEWYLMILLEAHYKVNTRVWCRLCRLQLSSPPACQSQESSAERNLWNNFSGFIGKSASFPCSCETLSQDFVEIGADKKLVKSLSAKMWRSGLDYPPVPWNLRLGTMKPIEKFGKVSCQHGQ